VFLTAEEDDDYLAEAMAVGARGYVAKQRLQSDLLPALHLAHAGHLFISPHAFIGRTTEGIIEPKGTIPLLRPRSGKMGATDMSSSFILMRVCSSTE